MGLYLVEVSLSDLSEAHLKKELDGLASGLQGAGQLIEVQIGTEAGRGYIVVATDDKTALTSAVEQSGLPVLHTREVLLVGDELDNIKDRRGSANYLVEWNLPAGLTMEKYLARKEAKSPLYDQVPEINFERTYVATDMSKCLCFYDSPDEDCVKRARDIVEAPIDTITTVKRVDS